MSNETETQAEISPRAEFEKEHGQTWTTEEMQAAFTVKGFSLGVCVVNRKSDGQLGSLDFTRVGDERLYYRFVEHNE